MSIFCPHTPYIFITINHNLLPCIRGNHLNNFINKSNPTPNPLIEKMGRQKHNHHEHEHYRPRQVGGSSFNLRCNLVWCHGRWATAKAVQSEPRRHRTGRSGDWASCHGRTGQRSHRRRSGIAKWGRQHFSTQDRWQDRGYELQVFEVRCGIHSPSPSAKNIGTARPKMWNHRSSQTERAEIWGAFGCLQFQAVVPWNLL